MIARLANDGRAVMAGGTGTGHGVVIESGGRPGQRAVACPAIRGRADMRCRLANDGVAVMAA